MEKIQPWENILLKQLRKRDWYSPEIKDQFSFYKKKKNPEAN